LKEIDPIMKQTFLRDFSDYLAVIKALEMEQLDIVIGIEQLTSLIEDVIDDMFIMDQTIHDFFIEERNKISLVNREAKEERRRGMKEPRDALDERNLKRLLLLYDLEKHRKLLKIIKSISYNQGWFR
jgi:hypothetical protein